jgi:hypothetical protein
MINKFASVPFPVDALDGEHVLLHFDVNFALAIAGHVQLVEHVPVGLVHEAGGDQGVATGLKNFFFYKIT